MKLSCQHCNHVLTKDLQPCSEWAIWGSAYWIADEGWFCYEVNGTKVYNGPDEQYEKIVGGHKVEIDMRYSIEEGTFMELPIRPECEFFYEAPARFYLNRDDCEGMKFIPFEQGMGCCDNNGIEVKCGGCETVVGYEYYDCYDDWHIEVPKQSVIKNS